MPSVKWNLDNWSHSLQQHQTHEDSPYGDQWGTPETKPQLKDVIQTWLEPFVGADKTILEIGPGGGRWTQYLLHSKALYCVDINPLMLDYIAERFSNPSNLNVYLSQGNDLPKLAAGTVDFMFSFGTFVHIEPDDISRYLRNLKPLLHPGSDVVIQYADKYKPKAAKNIHFSQNNALIMEYILCKSGYQVIRHNTELLLHSNIVHARPVFKTESPALRLATEAPVRVMAWPDYQNPKEMLELFAKYGSTMANFPGLCLCLRRDPTMDPPLAAVHKIVSEAFNLTNKDLDLSVLFVDNPLASSDWASLGKAVSASLMLPSSTHGVRAAFSSALRVPRIRVIEDFSLLK